MTGSNCRPSPCKGDALPTELITLKLIIQKTQNDNKLINLLTKKILKKFSKFSKNHFKKYEITFWMLNPITKNAKEKTLT